jgi:ABC-type transport system substrate-binding protein
MNYWLRTVSRRRVLKTGVALSGSAAALALLSCGGGDTKTKDASGLLSDPVDTTARAKPGGIYEQYTPNDTPSLDPIGSNAGAAVTHGMFVYSRLVRYRTAKFPNRADGSVDPDAAASWEVSPDGLQYTFKIRPNLKYDPRPPTNNRAMTSADVKFSWGRYSTLNAERDVLTNSISPDAPIISVDTPDAQTVTMKLAFPYAPLPQMLGYRRYMQLMPVETDGGFNFRTEMRGSGAFRLAEYQSSLKFEYRKNPDWYDVNKIFIDGVRQTIIPEYATGLAQFRAGNLWIFPVRADEIIQTKNDLPKMVMQRQDYYERATQSDYRFGFGQGSVFRDERRRKAASMLIDRDQWIETFYNVENFRSAGIDMSTRWSSHVSAGEEAFWLDPKGKELGPDAKFFLHDPAEARKLVRAAGFNGAVESEFTWTTNAYTDAYRKQAQVVQGMIESSGDFKFKANPVDYATVFVPKYHEGKGGWNGMATGSLSARPDIDGWLFSFARYGSTKSWIAEPEPKLTELVDRQRRELDGKKRIEILKEIQRYGASKFYWMVSPGQALSFTLAWPWLANRGVNVTYDGGGDNPQESLVGIWYDETQKNS